MFLTLNLYVLLWNGRVFFMFLLVCCRLMIFDCRHGCSCSASLRRACFYLSDVQAGIAGVLSPVLPKHCCCHQPKYSEGLLLGASKGMHRNRLRPHKKTSLLPKDGSTATLKNCSLAFRLNEGWTKGLSKKTLSWSD